MTSASVRNSCFMQYSAEGVKRRSVLSATNCPSLRVERLVHQPHPAGPGIFPPRSARFLSTRSPEWKRCGLENPAAIGSSAPLNSVLARVANRNCASSSAKRSCSVHAGRPGRLPPLQGLAALRVDGSPRGRGGKASAWCRVHFANAASAICARQWPRSLPPSRIIHCEPRGRAKRMTMATHDHGSNNEQGLRDPNFVSPANLILRTVHASRTLHAGRA